MSKCKICYIFKEKFEDKHAKNYCKFKDDKSLYKEIKRYCPYPI